SCDLELIGVDRRALSGQLDVLQKEVIRVHADCSGGVFQGSHRQRAGLWMIRSPPRSLAANVVNNVSVLSPLIRNGKNVWYWRFPSAADTTRTPGLRVPGCKRAVLFNSNFSLRVIRRSSAGTHQLCFAFVEHLYRLSACLFGQARSGDVPLVGSELASESAADVILLDTNVRGRNIQRSRYLPGRSADCLGRKMG